MSGENETGKSVVLPEGEYAAFLAQMAAKIADERAAKRENFYRGVIGLVVGVLAFLGYTSISNIKADLREVISASLRQDIASAVSEETTRQQEKIIRSVINRVQGDLDAKVAFIQLRQVASYLEEEKAFSPAERDEALSLLRDASSSVSIRNSAEFRSVLETVVDSFAAADLKEDIDQLSDDLGIVMTESPGIVLTMVLHYGVRVAGQAKVSEALLDKFSLFSKAARRHNFPEIALPYELALAFRQAGGATTSVTDELVQDAMYLEDGEKKTFLGVLNQFNAGPHPTPEFARIGVIFSEISDRYSAELAEVESSINTDNESRDLLDGFEQVLESIESAESEM